MTLEIAFRKRNLGQKSISFLGSSIRNKLSSDRKILLKKLYHFFFSKSEKASLKKVEWVGKNFNQNIYRYFYHHFYQNFHHHYCYHFAIKIFVTIIATITVITFWIIIISKVSLFKWSLWGYFNKNKNLTDL